MYQKSWDISLKYMRRWLFMSHVALPGQWFSLFQVQPIKENTNAIRLNKIFSYGVRLVTLIGLTNGSLVNKISCNSIVLAESTKHELLKYFYRPFFSLFSYSLSHLFCIIPEYCLKKSRIRETKHLSTDADSSTNTTVGWTKSTPKPEFIEEWKKIIKNRKT